VIGLSLDGYDDFRGKFAPFGRIVCGKGGRWSKGETRPPIRDGRRPGCEDDLLLPGVEFVMGSDVVGNLVVPGADIVASTGEDEVLGGADNFDRLW
jgi:hypothetical protein